MDELLYDLYYVKHNYDGIDNLYKKAKKINTKITKNDVKIWLGKQSSYQVNFTKVEKKKYLPIYSEVPNAYQIDLTFLPQYKKQNNNNYVLFTAIGINTRYSYVDYATNKRTDTILNMMRKFAKVHEVFHITGDLGSEFTNKEFINYLKDEGIEYNFYKSDSSKLGIINRFHRTLKSKVTQYITSSGSVKWIDVIHEIVDNLNNTYNRGIKAKPISVFNDHFLESMIIEEKKRITEGSKTKEVEFAVGDMIRVLNPLKTFENKMKPKYSDIYRIVKVNTNTVSILDTNGKRILFKKSRIIKVEGGVAENYKQPDAITKAVKENKIVRKMRQENLINEPTDTRTRVNPKQKEK